MPSCGFPDHDVNMRPAGIKSRAAFPAWPQPFIHRACNIFIGGCSVGSQPLPIRAARCASGHEIMSQPGCCQIQRQRAFIARVKRLHAWNLQESQIGFVGRRTCGQSSCNQANGKQAVRKARHICRRGGSQLAALVRFTRYLQQIFALIVLTAMKKWRLLNGVKILIALDGTGGLLYRYKLHPRLQGRKNVYTIPWFPRP